MLNNKTVTLDYKDTGILYSIDIQDLHIETVDGFSQKSVAFVPGTNTVRVLLSGINVNMDVDGKIKALYLIPLSTSHCNITNVTIQLDFGVTTGDQIHW
jgi:hypothetical protein